MREYQKTVIVIEDDDVLVDSYKYYFESLDGFILKACFNSVEEALDKYESIYPDIIISDISMPGMDGIKGVDKFKSIDDKVKVIMVSVHDDVDYIVDSLKNKADGYLTKPINKDNIQDALNSVVNEGAPLSDKVSKKIINIFRKKKFEIFSDRENDILELFTKGYTYNAIAEELFVTSSTVNFHIQNIYSKLNVNSKSEAIKKLAEMEMSL